MDISSQLLKELLDMFISSVDMMHLLDDGFALGGQSGNDQRRSCPQVGSFDRGAVQPLHAADECAVQVGVYVRPHSRQFIDMLEPAFEYRLFHDAEAVGKREQHHDLGLQVGRKRRIRRCDDTFDRLRTAHAANVYYIIVGADLNTYSFEDVDQGRQMGRVAVGQRDVASRGRGGNHHGSGYDPVGNDVIRTRGKLAYALNRDRIRTYPMMFAPIAFRKFCRSWISGSRAAFVMVVVPSARTAAIMMFSVAPTLGKSRWISAP